MKSLHDDQVPQEIDSATGLPIGPLLANPAPAMRPQPIALDGRYCRLEPLDASRHREDLFAASSVPDAAARFRYLTEVPPKTLADMDAWFARQRAATDAAVYAVIDRRTGRAGGRQSLMRITPEHQCIEVGSIYWGPAIARSAVTTEAIFLFAEHVFETLGYRRYEWKCDALNAPSRAAAERFGFTYEGHFRRVVINKGRTRDTLWFSIIDDEWPVLKDAYRRWLDPANFEPDGRQKLRLSTLTAQALDSLRARAS